LQPPSSAAHAKTIATRRPMGQILAEICSYGEYWEAIAGVAGHGHGHGHGHVGISRR
jgi:hypothetical protein